MASKYASILKQELAEMPDEFFEVLTFGELELGQKFIRLPLPGDNSGHDGLRVTYYIFTKTRRKVRGWGIPTGEAKDSRGITSSLSHSMAVILVE